MIVAEANAWEWTRRKNKCKSMSLVLEAWEVTRLVRYPHLDRAIFRAGFLTPVYLVASTMCIQPQYTSIVIN
jgi:hypothetical protein